MLSIQLFGPPKINLNEQSLNVPRRKSRALLFYLAAHPEPITRDQALAFLWPDHNRTAAQKILRTTLYGLRHAVGDALLAEDDRLMLASGVAVDVRHFETELARLTTDVGQLTRILELYRGDFLTGFSLPDPPEFDDWVTIERERYRRLAVRGLTVLSQLHEARQDYRVALEALERALAFDPLQEDLQRACLRLHYLAGDRAGAIRRYENLVKLLDKEMGVPPMAETRALYDAIITDQMPAISDQPVTSRQPSSPAGGREPVITHYPTPALDQPLIANLQSPATVLPFVGRTAELNRLHELAVTHKLVLIEGEAGIGKTRLIEEFIRSAPVLFSTETAASEPLLGLIGQARELEYALPYQPVIEALRALLSHPYWPRLREDLHLSDIWLAEVARLLPELAVSVPAPVVGRVAEESRLWEGIHQFLVAVTRRRALIFAIDDLHWADASTLGLLGYLIRQVSREKAPIFFVAATRPILPRSPLATLQKTLLREGCLENLTLTRLSVEAITSLARHLSANYAHPLASWLSRGSEGNPFILAELVRYARNQAILLIDGTVNLNALSESPAVPPTVYALIKGRLDQLSEPARRVLDAAVAMGHEFEFEVVARAAALSGSAALDALDELRAGGLIYAVSADGLHYAFDHSLTMEVAYREVGELRHRLLHRQVAEALESIYRRRLDEVAGLLARHFAEGHASQRAVKYAIRAGQLATHVAGWTEAIGFYEQALAGVEQTNNEVKRLEILLALARVLLQSGQSGRAVQTSQSAFKLARQLANSQAECEARTTLVESLILQARYSEVIALAEQICATAKNREVVDAQFWWGIALSLEGADLAGASEHLHSAKMLLQQQDRLAEADQAKLAQIEFELGNVAAQQGDLETAVDYYRAALEKTRSLESDIAIRSHILAHNNLAYHLHLLNNPAAVEYAQTGLDLARTTGSLSLLPFLLSTLGEIALAQDDPVTAAQFFSEGLALAEQFAAPERIAGLTANLGLVAVRQGQTALAIHRFSTALARAEDLGTRHLGVQIRLWLAPLLPPAEARAHLAEARAIALESGYRRLLEEAARLEATLPL